MSLVSASAPRKDFWAFGQVGEFGRVLHFSLAPNAVTCPIELIGVAVEGKIIPVNGRYYLGLRYRYNSGDAWFIVHSGVTFNSMRSAYRALQSSARSAYKMACSRKMALALAPAIQ